MTFNKGDKVKFKSRTEAKCGIGPGCDAFLGTLTVTSSNILTYATNEHGVSMGCNTERLELAKPVYKVGDMVRVVKAVGYWKTGLLDAVCKVLVNDGSTFRPLMLDTTGWRYNHVWFDLDHVEPAGDIKPYMPDTLKAEPEAPLKAGDLAIYHGYYGGQAQKHHYPCKVVEVRNGCIKADFKLVVGGDPINYVEQAYRRPTKEELASDKFAKFVVVKPKLSDVLPTAINPFKPGDAVKFKAGTILAGRVEIVERLGDYTGSRTDTAVKFVDGDWDHVKYLEKATLADIAQLPTKTPTVTKARPMHYREKYIVVSMNAHGILSPSSNPYTHMTMHDAEKEALRLANLSTVKPGETFVVFSAISKAVPPVKVPTPKATLTSI